MTDQAKKHGNDPGPVPGPEGNPECLHCEILELVQRHVDRHGTTLDVLMFKQVEAIAAVIAGLGDPALRGEVTAEAADALRREVERLRAEREAAGVPDHPVTLHRIN